MTNKVNPKLTSGLPKEQADEVNSSYNASALFRRKLVELLKSTEDELVAKMLKDEKFVSQDWQISQIKIIAEIKALRKISHYLK